MANRSATDTIKGYFYQFDLSILKLLTLGGENDSVEIECIEDIDVHTASESIAIQCKYYEQTEYNHSVIKKAVQYMLTHFSEVKAGKKPVKYMIYGHYKSGHDKLQDLIDVEFLKAHFLTYTKNKVEHCHHEELHLNDDDLKGFLAALTINIRASEFQQQFQEVNQQLMTTFNCRPFEAEYFYYNNALRIIKELATPRDSTKRAITKKDFLTRINTKTILFNEWFIQKKGKSAHLKAIRAEYFGSMNVSPFERFFLVEINPVSDTRSTLKELIFKISNNYSKLSPREPTPFCPYLFIHGIQDHELIELKSELWNEGFWVIDGYDFQGAKFNPTSIARQATHHNPIKIKVLNSLSDLELTINSISAKTREIYQFHLEADGYCDFADKSVKHVKIQVAQLSDIKEII